MGAACAAVLPRLDLLANAPKKLSRVTTGYSRSAMCMKTGQGTKIVVN